MITIMQKEAEVVVTIIMVINISIIERSRIMSTQLGNVIIILNNTL